MNVRSSLTRSVSFFALHHLRRADWSDARNLEAFGPLSDPAGHGNDYACTVQVSGPLVHGMVMDLAELDRLLDLVVRAPLAGRHLNLDVPSLAAAAPCRPARQSPIMCIEGCCPGFRRS